MCFSAPVSFIAAGVVGGFGVASLKRTRRRERILAIIPLFFAFQQGLEGIQWLVAAPSVLSDVAAYGFLFVALLLWPIYVPFMVHRLDPQRRRLMRWFLVIGIAISTYNLWYLLMHSLSVEKLGPGISYGLGAIPWLVIIGYAVSVIGSLLISSIRFFRVIGIVVGAAAIASWAFFFAAFASVWCFFAAVISGAIYLYIVRK